MSARSFIIVKHTDGRYMGQYCHSDGYPEHVGRTLVTHYSDQQKAEHLSSLGDLSALYEHADPLPIAPPSRGWGSQEPIKAEEHNFEHPQQGVTIAYSRDRQEQGVEAQNVTYGHLPEVDQEFEYLWDGTAWRYRKMRYDDRHELNEERLPWLEIPMK